VIYASHEWQHWLKLIFLVTHEIATKIELRIFLVRKGRLLPQVDLDKMCSGKQIIIMMQDCQKNTRPIGLAKQDQA
jgi:hypothetical protein